MADGVAAATSMSDHDAARAYWRDATDTFVAQGDYYARAAAAVRAHLLPLLRPTDVALDIGCGDGTFTALMAGAVGHVDAYDLSPALIAQAEARRLPKVTFTVGDATEAVPGAYDLVTCMGVLVCIVDDAAFAVAVRSAAASVKPGGLLVLRETVSGWGRRVHHDGDYVACYRPRSAYLEKLGAAGLTLENDQRLAVWSRIRRRTNHLWVFRRLAAAS